MILIEIRCMRFGHVYEFNDIQYFCDMLFKNAWLDKRFKLLANCIVLSWQRGCQPGTKNISSRGFNHRCIESIMGISQELCTGFVISCVMLWFGMYRFMDLLSDTWNCALRMCREWRERFPRHRLQRKKTISRSRHASRHVLHARVVVHVGIANPRWWGKRSHHSQHMHNPQFYVSGKRPMPIHQGCSSGIYAILPTVSVKCRAKQHHRNTLMISMA